MTLSLAFLAKQTINAEATTLSVAPVLDSLDRCNGVPREILVGHLGP